MRIVNDGIIDNCNKVWIIYLFLYSILSLFLSMVFTLLFGIQIPFQISIWVCLIHIWIEFKLFPPKYKSSIKVMLKFIALMSMT